ncbi:hypothetical protein K469DRAFT_752638 [Zopfia rhizophila CBS 207.26]|uniref:Uncharacterized protein n=1 Tax=Zopfia rhizophila CBS 207.26 TaxID=1314779 RepID=A0A6A6DUV8_9PEZI|nr:hypothetical protein K469DRAFT_752638 [Zopfia rhizophila CBS 207.26]
MAEPLSLPQLSLDLPSSRMSLDFSTFTKDLNLSTRAPSRGSSPSLASNKSYPSPRSTSEHFGYRHGPSLPKVEEESDAANLSLSRQNSLKWPWRKSNPNRHVQSPDSACALSRTTSSASIASTASTSVSSTFSSVVSNSTRTSYTSSRCNSRCNSRPMSPFPEEQPKPSLSSLPSSLLQQILSYALLGARGVAVSIGPEDNNRHLQLRYHRPGLDYINLHQILKHPLFLVSHQIRNATLDVFFAKCQFVVDLHSIYYSNVSSTINENMRKHQKFWTDETPQMVKYSLRRLSKLHIRLPVPSTEAGVHRGRGEKDWMDGSDGKGGGGYRVKSMKKEQEDALEIQKYLDAIVKLVLTSRRGETLPQPLTRSLSSLSSLRRSKSVRSERSKSARDSRSQRSERPEIDVDDTGERKPLKRLDIVFVKRTPRALVLQEALGLVRILKTVPVTGFTKYYFELNGQKFIWATKRLRRWEGMEPSGAMLLEDLQHLTVAERDIEPIRSPTEFKYVGVDRGGQLRLLDSALRKSVLILEKPKPIEEQDSMPPIPNFSLHRTPLIQATVKSKDKRDSFAFIMQEGMEVLGSVGTRTGGAGGHIVPPSIEDLKKIAEDIRRSNY